MSSDTRVIDRVKDWQDASDNSLVPPPDLKEMLVKKAAVDQQLTHTPAGHPDFAKLQAQQTALAAAISTHPKNSGK